MLLPSLAYFVLRGLPAPCTPSARQRTNEYAGEGGRHQLRAGGHPNLRPHASPVRNR